MIETNAVRVMSVLIKIALVAFVVGLLMISVFFFTGAGSPGAIGGIGMFVGGMGTVIAFWSLFALLVLWIARYFVRRSAARAP
jgi:hypothetical protein